MIPSKSLVNNQKKKKEVMIEHTITYTMSDPTNRSIVVVALIGLGPIRVQILKYKL